MQTLGKFWYGYMENDTQSISFPKEVPLLWYLSGRATKGNSTEMSIIAILFLTVTTVMIRDMHGDLKLMSGEPHVFAYAHFFDRHDSHDQGHAWRLETYER